MPNNFSTIKENISSKKSTLVRIKPKRYMNDDFVLNAGVYEAPFEWIPVAVQKGGVDLSYDSLLPTDSWFYINGTLKVKTTLDAPVVVFYYRFFTVEKTIVVGKDPETPATDLREWQPLLVNQPKISLSVENVLNGKLSIARSSINLVNDGTFFLGDNDSFFNAEIKIWIFLDDVANIQKIFNGKITDLKISGNKKVSISFEEQTSGLAEPCYLGDVENEIYTNDVNTDPNRKGLPIPFVFGTASKYELAAVNTDESVMIPESMMEATCISFSTNIGGTTNRIWTACRSTYFGYNSFQITGVDNSNPNYTIVSTTSNPDFNDVLVGDTVTVNTTNFRVTKKDSATNKIYMKPKFIGLAVNDWFFRWEVSVIIVDDTGAKFYPDTSHYTYTYALATTGGNRILNIQFNNNFETSLSMGFYLNPQIHKVYFRARPVYSAHGHASVLKYILDKAGVTTNATSFTNADSAYPIKVNFTIPTAQENDYAASYKYAEDILQSMLGYLSLNNSLEYEYKIFDTISTTNEITSSDIIEDSFGQEINYKDLVYQLVAYNIHCNSTDFQATSSATAKNEKTRFLHGVTNTDRFVHVLEDITTRINDLLAVRSERQARYVFSTKTKNLDSIIGDKYLLTRTGFVQRPIQILAVDKSSKEVDIIATDFIGI